MEITNKKHKATELEKIIFVSFILCSALVISFQVLTQQSTALGGGFIRQSTTTQTINATTTTIVTNAATNYKGVYEVLGITTFNPSITVSGISDTQGNTYHPSIQSKTFEDTEIWYANYTGTNFGADTITITYSGSTSGGVIYSELTGVTNIGSMQTGSNHGTASTISVSSFTPNNNFACMTMGGIDTGSATGSSYTLPNFVDYRQSAQLGALTFDYMALFSNNWNNFGATTFSSTVSPTSSPQWDYVYSCFTTAGTAPTTTTTTTSTTSVTTFTATSTLSTATITTGASGGSIHSELAVVQATGVSSTTSTFLAGTSPARTGILNHENFLLLSISFQQKNAKLTSVTDNQSDSWLLSGRSSTNYDTETWYSHYTGSNFASNILVTLNINTTATFLLQFYVLSGLNTTATPNIITSIGSGTISPMSVAQFNPPSHSVCLVSASLNTGTTNTLSLGELNYYGFPNTEIGTGAINTFYNIQYSTPNWNFSDGLTTLPIPISATGLTPTWDELVTCFQTGQTRFVTTTSTSTTSTTTLTSTTTIINTNTTTTSTSTFSSTTTLTSTNTSFVTSTGTVIPEPLHSTDLLLILLAILIFLILICVGLVKRNPFPTFLGAMVLFIMNVGLYTNNLIIYGQNEITTPLWVNEMITLLVVFAFILVVYQVIKRRY
jgi:hypothetical protein